MSAAPETPPNSTPNSPLQVWAIFRGIGGAIVGGALGYVLVRLLYHRGLYGIMLPGVLIGLGAGLAARSRSQALGILCALLAVGATLFTDWHVRFSDNNTFPFFLSQLHTLGAVPLVMMVLGVVAAYWFGQGR